MYSIASYGAMINDRVRMDAYTTALRQAIRPESVVLDIGAGTGYFSLLACQFGARHVYAIEPDSSIQVARQLAQENGLQDRITFIQDFSTRVEPPTRADLIISDLRGVLPPFQHHIPTIVDTRRRWLAPDGVLLPQRDVLWAAPIEAAEAYTELAAGYTRHEHGLVMETARRMVMNNFTKFRRTPSRDQFLSPPQAWATLDYTTITDPNVHGRVVWDVTRPGTGHGLCLWFDATIAPGVTFTSGPDASAKTVYGTIFFPWTQPLTLEIGDRVEVELRGDLIGEDYVWSWQTAIHAQGDPQRTRARFQQSSFLGQPHSVGQLTKRAESHRPRLNPDGQIDAQILGCMQGQQTLLEIAQAIATEFPARFPTPQEALARVRTLSETYSG